MNSRKALVTFSWDDGHLLDTKIAKLFSKYDLSCTFYVPKQNSENLPTLSSADLRALSQDNFDIHSHTLNHVYLGRLTPNQQAYEIQSGKKYIEDSIGKEDHIFCYPGGRYSRETIGLVRGAGFTFARTIDMGFTCAYSANNYLMPTTSIVAPLSRLQIMKHSLKRLSAVSALNIYKFNKAIIEKNWGQVEEHNGKNVCYHFWGHSWEIEKYDLWDCLETLIQSLIASNSVIVSNKEFYERSPFSQPAPPEAK